MIMPRRVLVSGTGLIGTSIALALRDQGAEVFLSDADLGAARLAAGLGAGAVVPDLRDARGIADVAVLAMPPAAVGRALAFAQECAVADVYTDVASVKVMPARQARDLGCDLEAYVPAHPLAGRERHGPVAARTDLFLGRTWALCPLPETSRDAVDAVTALVVACGANPVVTDPATHDRCVALVSHVPHLVAAAMAARLEHAPPTALALAGQGLRDVTRIAASGAAMWLQILTANAGPASAVLRDVAADLTQAADALDSLAAGDEQAVKQIANLLERGIDGVHRIPGKHGGPTRDFAAVQVVIPDRPGELARLFQAADDAGVNIEDVSIEHSPGLPVGVAELWVRPDAAATLSGVLAAGGWPVRR